MLALKTAVIQHNTPHGTHHDWLIEDPTAPNPAGPDARLWTARVLPPPAHWPQLGRFDLDILPPHRRAYLTYQGEVTNNRGRVQRVGSGTCLPELWTVGRIVMKVELSDVKMRLDLRRVTDERWVAVTAASPRGGGA